MAKRNDDPIDWELVQRAAEVMCSAKELAHVCKKGLSTLQRHCKEKFDKTLQEKMDEWQVGQKESLRRSQFELAKKNAAMSIWLGKQHLDQREPHDDALKQMSFADLVTALNENAHSGKLKHDTLKQEGKVRKLLQDCQ